MENEFQNNHDFGSVGKLGFLKEEDVRRAFKESGLEYDEDKSKGENYKVFSTFLFLEKRGICEKVGENYVIDSKEARGLELKNSSQFGKSRINRQDIIPVLASIKGYDKESFGQEENSELRPVVVLPESLADLCSSSEEGYSSRNKKALLQPWKIGRQIKGWVDPLVLSSGEQSNLSEMAIISALNNMGAQRESGGKLTVIHPKTGKRVAFSPRFIRDFGGIIPGARENGKTIIFNSNPYEFTKKYLPNLEKSGVLRKEDFRILGGRSSTELFSTHKRFLNPKAPFLTFTNSEKHTAKYYIGRTKLVGSDIPIDNMYAEQLDSQIIGIVKEQEGKKEIIRTFPLLEGEQLSSITQAVSQRLQERGLPVNGKNLSMYTVIGEKVMKNLIKEYSAADYLPPRVGESAKDFYKRIRPLDDVDFVTEKVQTFFSDVGASVHNLPWSEQLMLSRILLENKSVPTEEKLKDFAKQYGVKGVRAFVSMDYDRSLGPKILDIGKRAGQGLAKEVFQKYGEILDAAGKVEADLTSQGLSKSEDDSQKSKVIQENLTKRAKNLLVEISDDLQKVGGQLATVDLLKKLEAIRADIISFAAIYKIFSSKENMQLRDFPGVNIQEKDSTLLTEKEREEMSSIFSANRLNSYPEKLRKHVEADFGHTLESPGHTFRLLRHEGKLIAFLHYDELDNDNLYVGSLNLHPSAKDGPLAVVMLKEAMAEKADKNLKAVVWADNPARLFYTKFLGFKKIGEDNNYKGTGEKYWILERRAKTEELEKAA